MVEFINDMSTYIASAAFVLCIAHAAYAIIKTSSIEHKEGTPEYSTAAWAIVKKFILCSAIVIVVLFAATPAANLLKDAVSHEHSLARRYMERFLEDEFDGVAGSQYFVMTGNRITLNNRFYDRLYEYLTGKGYEVDRHRVRADTATILSQRELRRVVAMGD
jgi:cytochrome bd-type quinol oxidase subunit 2